MKKLFFITGVIILMNQIHNTSIAQNLVFNPGFEDTVKCPDGSTTISYSTGWLPFSNTPDYFNTCSSNSNYSIPNNGWGNQNPYSVGCNAYAGFWGYGSFSPNGREFIGHKLLSPLSIGQKYFFSCKVSLAETSNCGINNIGVLFLTNVFNPLSVNNAPKVYSPTVILDTLNWISISGSFIADSAYGYIVLGNFFSDSLTTVSPYAPPHQIFGYAAYYYVDDICVSIDSAFCYSYNYICNVGVEETQVNAPVKISPNPSTGFFYIENNTAQNIQINIYNPLGQEMLSKTIIQDDSIDLTKLSSGIYYIKSITSNRIFNSKLLLIH